MNLTNKLLFIIAKQNQLSLLMQQANFDQHLASEQDSSDVDFMINKLTDDLEEIKQSI